MTFYEEAGSDCNCGADIYNESLDKILVIVNDLIWNGVK